MIGQKINPEIVPGANIIDRMIFLGVLISTDLKVGQHANKVIISAAATSIYAL